VLNAIRNLTPKPITTIINTHTHGDHVSGNVEFPATVEVITQENTAANMKKMAPVTGLAAANAAPAPNIFEQNGGRGLPKRTFKDRMTIGSGSEQIELYYFGRGHTNGDAFVVFPAARTMHAGDVFSGKNLPFLDANTGGSGVLIADTLQKAHDTIKNVDTIITGHSTQMTWTDLRDYITFNRDFLEDVRAGKQAGKTADQIAASWKMPAKYVGYAEPQANRIKANVQVVFDELGATRSSR